MEVANPNAVGATDLARLGPMPVVKSTTLFDPACPALTAAREAESGFKPIKRSTTRDSIFMAAKTYTRPMTLPFKANITSGQAPEKEQSRIGSSI
jgi:hypothetical protein